MELAKSSYAAFKLAGIEIMVCPDSNCWTAEKAYKRFNFFSVESHKNLKEGYSSRLSYNAEFD